MPVRIKEMQYGGAGLNADGLAVPFTLPGELVEVAAGELATVIEASPSRVHAPCVHFGSCGGCQYQHAEYAAQVEIKRELLRDMIKFAGIEVSAGGPWGYRNRVRMRVEVLEGRVRLGYNRRQSNEFLPIEECPLAAPVLWRTAAALVEAEQTFLKHVAEIELFCTGDEASVQLSLSLREPVSAFSFDAFCREVKAQVPELTGAGAVPAEGLGRRARKSWEGAAWGAPGLTYHGAGRSYWVSRGSFFQVNRFLVGEMVSLVTEQKAGALAWDLYAGVGLFSKALADRFNTVVAVEGSPISAMDLRQAAPNVRSVQASTVEFLRRAVLERERPELIVMDPPRSGLGIEACKLLARVSAAEIVYVSCDPTTLARDLDVLTRSKYGIERVVMVDMFPQTFHIETIVSLRRQTMDPQAVRV